VLYGELAIESQPQF